MTTHTLLTHTHLLFLPVIYPHTWGNGLSLRIWSRVAWSDRFGPAFHLATMQALPRVYGILLYDNSCALDFMGPLAFLNQLPDVEIILISDTTSVVSTGRPYGFPKEPFLGLALLPSYTIDTAPPLDVLLVPGGIGTRTLLADRRWQEYVTKVYPDLQYLLSVCTGSSILARSGVLDNKRATSNKRAFEWVESLSSAVQWIKEARWVVDGNVWTSSGVEAGTDMAYAFVASLYGDSVASHITNILEYIPNTNPSWDPFAAVYPPSSHVTSTHSEVVSRDNPIVTQWGVLAFQGVIGLDIAAAVSYLEFVTTNPPIVGTVSFIGVSPEPVEMASRALNGGQRLNVTESVSGSMKSFDVLIVPGLPTAGPFPLQSELVTYIRSIFPSLKHIMSIGTGSMLLAEAGILNGRKATTSKQLFDSAISPYQKEHAITWTSGRWVRDGNVWTASGSAAALDACAALCVEMYGEDATQQASKYMEYLPHPDASDDRFSKVWSHTASEA